MSRASRFELDLGSDSLHATSTFHVLLSSAADHRDDDDGKAESTGAVEVATVAGEVSLCVPEQRLRQSVRLAGLRPVFDDAVRRLAEGLAYHEARHGGGRRRCCHGGVIDAAVLASHAV